MTHLFTSERFSNLLHAALATPFGLMAAAIAVHVVRRMI